MEERLVVKNFGPIKDIDIRIGKLTVLIGEQATGKSTLGKLLAIYRDFENIAPVRSNTLKFNGAIYDAGMEYFISEDSYIMYKCLDYMVKSRSKRDRANHDLEEENENWLRENNVWKQKNNDDLEEENDKSETTLETIVRPFSEQLIKAFEDIDYIFSDSTAQDFQRELYKYESKYQEDSWIDAIYVYAERSLQSIFSLGKGSVNQMSDGLFSYLATIDNIARTFSKNVTIEPLGIEYKNQNGIGYFRKSGSEKYHKMQNAASGYQSVVPIVLLMEYYTQIRKKKKTFIIEEPELNLFPTTQHRLMQYLVSNLNQTENQILITTHSPYVLAALNNMLNAYKSGQIDKERTTAILPEQYWLNAEEVTAYRLMPDGTAKDLMNRELSMIHSEEIDEASGVINRQFDDLVTIQLEAENG